MSSVNVNKLIKDYKKCLDVIAGLTVKSKLLNIIDNTE